MCPTFHCNLTVQFTFDCLFTVQCRSYSKKNCKSALQLFNCTWSSKVGTPLKTVKNTLNIFAVYMQILKTVSRDNLPIKFNDIETDSIWVQNATIDFLYVCKIVWTYILYSKYILKCLLCNILCRSWWLFVLYQIQI